MNVVRWLRSRTTKTVVLGNSTLRISEIGSSVIVNISMKTLGGVAVSYPSVSTVRKVNGRTSTWYYLEPQRALGAVAENSGVKIVSARHVGA